MAEQNQQNKNEEKDLNQLLKVRREKLKDLQDNGKDPFQITKFDVTAHSSEIKDNFEQMDGKEVTIAGRMMSKRVMGKASFCNVQDLKGNIQSYVARDSVGEEAYKDFKKMDIGDIVGIKGTVFRTKMGEISVHAESIVLLSKSLQILPEKFHGLTNTDIRYRQRYVDLIMNPEVKDTFVKRSQILKEIRNFLDGRGFMEVETPMLVANAGGAAARPFETHYNALDEDVKLRISLELYLKRLIVGGLERVYEIGRVFRNEGVDTRHNPEFTLMELYQAFTDYHGMMDLAENLYRFVAQEVLGTTQIPYGEYVLDLGKPFERITMLDAVKKYAGVDFNEIHSDEEAKAVALSSADDSRLSAYHSENKELEQLDRIACNTLHDCMQKVFEDGPKRDQRLWMGDLRLQALANYETYQMNDMVKGCLYLFGALPMENGQVGACVFLEPEPEVDDTSMFDYSLLYVVALWDYYKQTKDKEALRDLWETARTQISLAQKRVDNGIVRDRDVLGWCFLDWSLELNKQAGAQGVLLYAMQSAIAIAQELRENRDAECLKGTYEVYRKAAKAYFYDEKKGLFVSGENRQISYASQVWLILGGVVDSEEGLRILHNVAADREALEMVTPYMYHYYIEALLKCNADEEALAVLTEYWGGMARLGADTFWELYNPKNPDESPYGGTIVNSYCHAWSCAPAYFLRKYFGEN